MANFCTWNPLRVNTTAASSSVGNLLATMNNNSQAAIAGTIDVVSGKWYWEVLINQINAFVGVTISTYNGYANIIGIDGSLHYHASNGNIYEGTGGANTNTAYGATSGDGDVIGVALNMDDRTIAFYKNGTLLAAAVSLPHTSAGYTPSFSTGTGGAVVTGMANFGQLPWRYDPPSGFLALNTKNLPEPVISNKAEEKPEDYFNVVTYTGNGGTLNVPVGFAPDFVWIKNRSNGFNHRLYDSIRGASRALQSNQTNAESTYGAQSFTSDGFQFTSDAQQSHNTNEDNYVAWCWKAGGAAISNPNGDIPSNVSANTTSGFSITTYTGDGTNGTRTVGHGLSQSPEFVIVKNTDEDQDWMVWTSSLPSTQNLRLNSINGPESPSNRINSVNSTTVELQSDTGTKVNSLGDAFVMYCWHSVEGYSKFGSYQGDDSVALDGAFIYTGFKPAFLIFKRANTGSAGFWGILDAARSINNPVGGTNTDSPLHANENFSEVQTAGAYHTDFLSNGFKFRSTQGAGSINTTGGTYIYMAFAESPFKYSAGR